MIDFIFGATLAFLLGASLGVIFVTHLTRYLPGVFAIGSGDWTIGHGKDRIILRTEDGAVVKIDKSRKTIFTNATRKSAYRTVHLNKD